MHPMATEHALAHALRTFRKVRGLSQEAFGDVSSRTYISTLERGLKSPTLAKIEVLCEVMDIHPVTLLVLAYGVNQEGSHALLQQVRDEIAQVLESPIVP